MKNVDLKLIDQNREKEMYQDALLQLDKLQEHGVFYISSNSPVEAVSLVKRYAQAHNVRELSSDSETTGTLMTVKHYVPRILPMQDEFFSKTEKEQKLDVPQPDEFPYITGIVNAVITDMFKGFKDTYQGNIEERKEFINKFKDILVRSIDKDSKKKIDEVKIKALETVANTIILEPKGDSIDKATIDKIINACFVDIDNLTNDKKDKLITSVHSNTGALSHVYILPSYILRSSSEKLLYVTQYLLEIVMSSYYEMKKFVNEQADFNICNNYKIAILGSREDKKSMPVKGFKSIDLDILPLDVVNTYLEIYQTRMQEMYYSENTNNDDSQLMSDEVKDLFYNTFKELSFLEFITLINDMAMNEIKVDKDFINTNRNYKVDQSLGIKSIISNITFDNIAGVDNVYEYAQSLLISIENPTKLEKYNIPSEKGILLAGASGTAKSSLAKAIANFLKIPMYQFEVGAFMSHLVGRSENNMKSFLDSLAGQRCILWIDEFEKAFAGASSEVTDSGTSSRVNQIFLTFMQESKNVIFIATANDITRLPVEFMRSGRFDKKFFIDLPSTGDRKKIFSVILKTHNLKHLISEENNELFSKLSEHYTGADIQNVIINAIRTNLDKEITSDFILNEINIHKPDAQSFKKQYKALREHSNDFISASKDRNNSNHLGCEDYIRKENTENFSFNTIGGMENIKSYVEQEKHIFLHPEEAKEFGVLIPKGILFAGFSGNGKTAIAKAIANELGVEMYSLMMSDIINKYVGESETNFKKVLQSIISISKERKIVFFIDECDKAFGSSTSEYKQNIVQEFLVFLQSEHANILVIVTANDTKRIPPELMRSGRFDKKFFVNLPTKKERSSIFKGIICKLGKGFELSEITRESIASKTDGYTGADIENMINEVIKAKFIKRDFNKTLTESDFTETLSTYTPDSNMLKYQVDEKTIENFTPASNESKSNKAKSSIGFASQMKP